MSEYIRRESVTVRLNRWKNQIADTYGENDEYVKCLEDTVHIIDTIPAADVAEVRHGRWEERIVDDDELDKYGFFRRRFYCSACGDWNTHGASKYCPKCGAKMTEV